MEPSPTVAAVNESGQSENPAGRRPTAKLLSYEVVSRGTGETLIKASFGARSVRVFAQERNLRVNPHRCLYAGP